ncbi:MAG: HAD-IB family hydrolase [Acidimicrobiales bacterium]
MSALPLDPATPAGHPRGAAFFDIDKTVSATPAMVAFARPLYDAGLIGKRLVAHAAWQHLRFKARRSNPARMAEIRAAGLEIIRGWDAAEVRRIVERSLPEVLAPAVYDDALALIRAHQRRGDEVWLVSAEPVEIVEPLGAFLGVDGTIGSEATVGSDGRYTGEAATWVYGPDKAVAIRALADRRGLDLAASFAYSDSATDLPMLEVVGHPRCINADRALSRTARRRGWTRLRFRPGKPTLAGGAADAAVVRTGALAPAS